MTENKIQKLTPLAETKFLSLYDIEYKNKKQDTRHWTVASRKDYKALSDQYLNGAAEKTDAAIIAAFHEDTHKIVCIKQFRVPLNDYVYELPAGLIDAGEDFEAAARRELKEETGLTLLDINYEKSKKRVYASAGMTDESAAMIFCTCSGTLSKDYLEDDEDIEVMLLSKNEVKKLLNDDVKMDMRAFITLQAFTELGEKLFK
ncbi:ADP-ribose pyrophosphatase [Clostridium acetobutylicum]|uniref:Nudix (MutT) family hydrolase n=1 Tax=Clostridium acetobutylicum (strain ATCC 824 / DSM 792 / JCM 1419 / IAM 19013 / LMG 5710 / NBRC 13948 / NRRL B-527 / VKM B-1787 / 2291 / W) TaxID=272562 RepID=Q97D79_CLOAB|nr:MULTISPECIES: NUDIX hydrolase [Clostridium]AAK81524.1 Nudix (MutT) family hydrolase [Clostridium acetobutylicum ATCC 824]ADZ22645.1 Nudix (MutT) family hydrolase [Clostridium acetobutylicum EA 2018]AEI32951.1 MutT/NUDIX family hydrolase [Clostridium acetobutylicum DSM 1731]AWV80803.1 NUDIX hydrolase [Clostridium acetobutylicum]MBC2393872.1 NUDIX hydrolase [Clostridium acetobutylicum]